MVILLLLRNPELTHSTTVWICARGRWRGVGDVRSSLGQTRVNPCSTTHLLSVWTRLRGPPSLAPQPSLAPRIYLSRGCWNSSDT